jgi:hypothetical protein
VRAAEGRPRTVVPLPFPIWTVSDVDGPAPACGGSCR